jgi:Family of unknown function (DUF6088)
MSKLTIKDRIVRSISMRQGEVVLRSDFDGMGSSAQVTRGLNELVKSGRIVRIGYGVFAKAKLSSISGKPVPREPLETLTLETLRKLGANPVMGVAQEKYASGKTTQIPMQTIFNIGSKRITRKITVGNRTASYENNYKSRA